MRFDKWPDFKMKRLPFLYQDAPVYQGKIDILWLVKDDGGDSIVNGGSGIGWGGEGGQLQYAFGQTVQFRWR